MCGIESDQFDSMCRTNRKMAEGRRRPGRPRTKSIEPESPTPAGGANVPDANMPWMQMMQQIQQQNQMMM